MSLRPTPDAYIKKRIRRGFRESSLGYGQDQPLPDKGRFEEQTRTAKIGDR
jgi:hypothetical protein